MADESAIIKMQSVIRKHMARREFSYLVRRERLLLVMMAIEDEKATLVQTLWRQRVVRGRDELASVTKLQAAARGKATRAVLLPERKVDVLVMRRAARTIQRYLRAAQARRAMMEQCRGVLEKQGQVVLPLFGKLELVVWKAHFVYVTATDLCYERLRKDKTPDPSTTKAIPYTEVREVRAVLGERLLCVGCERRLYKFAFRNRDACELWAANLVQLITAAGCAVEGFLDMPPDWEGDAARRDEQSSEGPDGVRRVRISEGS